jgi:CubicO group peptidase (beta-lactamase class C family)
MDGVGALRHGRSRRHLLMSVSKVVASLAVGLLEAAGKLAYESSVRDYLPELSEQWNSCTVIDVLDMASGVQRPEVDDPGAYRDPSHPFYRFEASLGWRDPGGEHLTPYELVTRFARSRARYRPSVRRGAAKPHLEPHGVRPAHG